MEKNMINKKIEQNQTWAELALIWAGGAVAISGFIVGGSLGMSMGFMQTVLVAMIGYAVIALLMILCGIQGSDLGKTAVEISEQVFGEQAAQFVMSFILVIACIGWFGIQTNLVGQSFTNFLMSYGIQVPVQVSSFIWGMIMLFTAIYGIKLIAILNKIAIPLLTLISLVVGYQVITKFGVASFLSYQPVSAGSYLAGISTVVGSLAVGAVISPDYFRYTAKRSNVTKATIVGVIPAGVLMITMGAILTLATGEEDITQIFMDYSTPALGMAAMLAATWTTNVTNAFSGGIAFSKIVPRLKGKENQATAIAGTVGTILAVFGILDHFIPIMSLLTAMIPPIAGIMMASYWLVNEGDPHRWKAVKGVNLVGIISWLLGAVPAALPILLSFFDIQLPSNPLVGIVISFVAYGVISKYKVA